jgi:hypothetical protein
MESPAFHPRPPWMDEEEHAFACTRLAEIDTLLQGMGATKEYCREYFQSGGGVCEHTVGGRCKRHRMTPTPLPKGKMCLLEFGQRATELRQQVHETCLALTPVDPESDTRFGAGLGGGSQAALSEAGVGAAQGEPDGRSVSRGCWTGAGENVPARVACFE